MKTSILKRTLMLLTAGAMTIASVGCANDTQNGALIGAGVGALAGGVIGNNVRGGNALGGAAIGAAGGALAGGLIGNVSDQQKRDNERYYERGRYDAERGGRGYDTYDRRYDDGRRGDGRGYYDR